MSIYIQYQNSDKLKLLINGITNNLFFDDTQFVKDFLNIKTATSEGLNLWGIILNQSRNIKSNEIYNSVFGFNIGIVPPDDKKYPQNFNHGTFYNPLYSPILKLDDVKYRGLLFLLYKKYTINNSLFYLTETIQQYEILSRQVPRGVPHVEQKGFCEIIYHFPYHLENYEIGLFKDTLILPRPLGYTLTILINN